MANKNTTSGEWLSYRKAEADRLEDMGLQEDADKYRDETEEIARAISEGDQAAKLAECGELFDTNPARMSEECLSILDTVLEDAEMKERAKRWGFNFGIQWGDQGNNT